MAHSLMGANPTPCAPSCLQTQQGDLNYGAMALLALSSGERAAVLQCCLQLFAGNCVAAARRSAAGSSGHGALQALPAPCPPILFAAVLTCIVGDGGLFVERVPDLDTLQVSAVPHCAVLCCASVLQRRAVLPTGWLLCGGGTYGTA